MSARCGLCVTRLHFFYPRGVLGGACYFEPVTAELSDWMPTLEHFPPLKREGGRRSVDNAVLAHRLCNRIDYSISVGRSYKSDLERIRKAPEAAAGS
jgi:hypothetical protein